MIKKIKVVLLIITLLSAYFMIFSTISYATKTNEEVINIVKNIPLYYAFDIEKIQLENRENFSEYMKAELKKYIMQLINDDSYSISITEVGSDGDFNIHRCDVDIRVYKGTTLIDTVQLGYENNTQLVMFGLMTVPYVDTEKSETEKIAYAENVLKNRYKIEYLQRDAYEIEKISQNTRIVALDTHFSYSSEELMNNFYRIIYPTSDSYTFSDEIVIIQREYTENDYKEHVKSLIENVPREYGFDIEKITLENDELLEYIENEFEREFNKYINDVSRRIEVEILEYTKKITSIELKLTIRILKDNTLENTVNISSNNDYVKVYSFISVPYGFESVTEYAENTINTKLNYTNQYELKQHVGSMFDNVVVLLETEKYGTCKAVNNSYEFIPQSDNSKMEYLVIKQKYSFDKGTGTEEDPYLISTPEDLYALRSGGANVYYKIVNDIDLTDATTNEKGIFYNGGKGWKSISNFNGVLDGNNKKIIGLTQNVTNENAGLFNYVNGGKIKDLCLENISINAQYDGTVYGYNTVAGLTSDLTGEVDNVLITGNIKVFAKKTSGSYAPLYLIGAIAGVSSNDSKISDTVNKANIKLFSTADSGNYGGILGMGKSTKIINCINYGNIESTKSGTSTGGIVGDIDSYYGVSEINDCKNYGNLNSKGTIGGIAGYSRGVRIKCCSNYGNMTDGNLMGGITGSNGSDKDKNNTTREGIIEKCFNIGSFNISIEDDYGCDTLGGISGMNSDKIYNCFNAGIINISGTNKNRASFKQFYVSIGGLIGENSGEIYTSYSNNLGNTKFSGNLIQYMNINALVGKMTSDNFALENCYYLDNELLAYTNVNDEQIETTGKLALEEMKKTESYIGFDFENVWKIETTGKYKFPRLIENGVDERYLKIGDVNGDGKANLKDWNRMYEHINETNLLTGEEFNRADINGDGKVNLKDWNRLYEHINETNPLW